MNKEISISVNMILVSLVTALLLSCSVAVVMEGDWCYFRKGIGGWMLLLYTVWTISWAASFVGSVIALVLNGERIAKWWGQVGSFNIIKFKPKGEETIPKAIVSNMW